MGDRKVDHTIVIGRDMKELILAKNAGRHTKISYIPNWFDATVFSEIYPKSNVKQDKIAFCYAGNIGRAQGVLDFAKIVKRVSNPNIEFIFCGGGVYYDALEYELMGLANVEVKNQFLRSEQSQIYDRTDVAVVLLGKGMFGLGVPSKAYNLIAAGLPILFVGPKDSEISNLVNENELGWTFDWSDEDELVSLLNSIEIVDRKI